MQVKSNKLKSGGVQFVLLVGANACATNDAGKLSEAWHQKYRFM